MKTKPLGLALISLAVILLGLLVYMKIDIDRQGVFLCEAVVANPTLTMEECPAHTSKSSFIIMVAFGIALIILAAGIYLFLLRKDESTSMLAEKKIDLSKLNDMEKRIVTVMQSHEGSMYQSDLMKELDVSKVQMTRLLDKLEAKKVIDRKRRGMTNIIILK